MNKEENQTSIVRQILQHELTWIVSIIAGVWGFVTTVILPISSIQTTLSYIQSDIVVNKESLTDIIIENKDLEGRVKTLEIIHR
jgi:hypothetical protein